MNKYIFDSLELFKYDLTAKWYLKLNSQLLNDSEFVKNMFIQSCLSSNKQLSIHLLETNQYIQELITDTNSCTELFAQICLKSNLELVQWFYNLFQDNFDIKNPIFIKNSCSNPEPTVIRWILKNDKFVFTKEIIEYIFIKMIYRMDLVSLKLTYQLDPNINFKILNGVYLRNKYSLDVYTPNYIIEWLKNILQEQMYSLIYNCDFKLIVIDNILTNNSNDKFNELNIFDKSDEFNEINECPLCLNNSVEIILNCSHKYCSYCIRKWVKKNKSCPICRKSNDIEFCYL